MLRHESSPPEGVHSDNALFVYPLWISPEGSSVHIHGGKVQKQLNASHLTGRLDYVPVEIQAIRIEQAEATTVVFKPDLRENLFQQNSVAIALIDLYLAPITD